jgi:DNA-binding transcriptional regulator/RsmH inhibitor MraZ
VQVPLPTQRLSPKHQVTLPKGARALATLGGEDPVCGRPDFMVLPTTGERFPVLTLMSEEELERREASIRTNPQLDPAMQAAWIANLNGAVRRMAVDAQRRIVLPAHFVDFLKLDREVYMFSTNVTVLAWNPDDWQRWTDAQDEQASGPAAPPPFLSV